MLTARQMLDAPIGGLMEKVAREANSSTPKLGIFRVVSDFLLETAGPNIENFRSKTEIKRCHGYSRKPQKNGKRG